MVIVFIYYLEQKNVVLSNKLTKYFEVTTCFYLTYLFDLEKAYKNMLEVNEKIALLRYF